MATPRKPPETHLKKGPKSSYRESVAAEFLNRLSQGETMTAICRDEGMPGRTTIYDWERDIPGFAERVARAKSIGFDAMAEECLDIADDTSNDFASRELKNGTVVETFNNEHVQRSKLRIETRLKLLSKWDRNRYGDQVSKADDNSLDLNITGGLPE